MKMTTQTSDTNCSSLSYSCDYKTSQEYIDLYVTIKPWTDMFGKTLRQYGRKTYCLNSFTINDIKADIADFFDVKDNIYICDKYHITKPEYNLIQNNLQEVINYYKEIDTLTIY